MTLTSTNNDHVERVCAEIHGNRHLTVQEVADEVGISIGSCIKFLQKLHMCSVSAEFVLRLLANDQKGNCVDINENFHKNITTGDETWVCGNCVETKMQSSQ
jgi:DNA-binding MurR/RpiR family transcriptional regulator